MSQAGEDSPERDEFERLRPAGSDAPPPDGGRTARGTEEIEQGLHELRPRGVGEVVDLGLDLVRSRFATCVGLAVLTYLPFRIIRLFFTPPRVERPDDWDAILQAFSGSIVLLVILSMAQILVTALTALVVFDALEGREARIAVTLRRGVARLPGLLVLSLVMTLLIALGACACVLPSLLVFMIMPFCACFAVGPALIVMWLLALAPYAYLLEDLSLGGALRRSAQLSTKKLFSTASFFGFGRWIGIYAVVLALMLPFVSLPALADMPDVRDWMLGHLGLSSDTFTALSVGVGALFTGLAIAIQSGALTAYYVDCRVRRDGLDLERWIARLRPAGSAAP